MSGGRFSLRARVAAAAAVGAVSVAAVVAATLVVLLGHREVAGLDRRLTALTDALSVRVPGGSTRSPPDNVGNPAARPPRPVARRPPWSPGPPGRCCAGWPTDWWSPSATAARSGRPVPARGQRP